MINKSPTQNYNFLFCPLSRDMSNCNKVLKMPGFLLGDALAGEPESLLDSDDLAGDTAADLAGLNGDVAPFAHPACSPVSLLPIADPLRAQ